MGSFSFRELVVVIDNYEPFAANEGFIDFVAVQVGKIASHIVPNGSIGAGVGL
jgi:hypothetical protein